MQYNYLSTKRTSKCCVFTLATLLLALMLVIANTSGGMDTAVANNVSPQLQQLAYNQPETTVRIIVQAKDTTSAIETTIEQFGGQILTELSIINAFVAEMDAASALALASNDNIHWVSLDAPLEHSQTEYLTALDKFDTRSFSNNQGTVQWGSKWFEIGENNGPKRGYVSVKSKHLIIGSSQNGVARLLPDLTGAAIANLSFDFARRKLDDAEDYVAIQISTDMGETWQDLSRIAGPKNDKSLNGQTLDITPYIGPNTAIRLISSPTLGRGDQIHFDNIQVTWAAESKPAEPVDAADLNNIYLETLNVEPVWDMGFDGEGIGIAIIDSGITEDDDFLDENGSLRLERHSFSLDLPSSDTYGHGTHVAGIAAGNLTGIAPGANIYSLRVSDAQGMAYESNVVRALQWVLQNKDFYNIRVVNLSINSTTEQSYHTSPMDAAAEILWFNGVVIVTSAGNKGPGGDHNTANSSPANDPFFITVGASDENDTPDRQEHSVAPFSAHGTTMDGFAKPEIVAPGKDIVSVLASTSSWAAEHPDRVELNGQYFRLSGTSMSAPMVTGAVALLLQAEPELTPDQVKYRLLHSGSTIAGELDDEAYDFAYLDVYAAITNATTESANTGIAASQLLWTGDDPVNWNSVNWGSVNWGSVNWGSVNWGSVNWGSVNWGSVSWDD